MKSLVIIIFICIFSITNVFSQLSGNYTIGSSGNYQSFNQAVDDLVNNGISGPVIFNIQTGTYNEQIIIPAITGTSSTNTITFQSETSDSSDVFITGTISSTDSAFTVKLNSTKFIKFKDISFSINFNSYYSNDTIINIKNCSDIEISNCQIIGEVNSWGDGISHCGIYYEGTNDNIDNPKVTNCYFNHIYYAVSMFGISENEKSNNAEISNNYFYDVIKMAIYVRSFNNVNIINNKIYSAPNDIAIYTKYSNIISITSNTILPDIGASYNRGIALSYDSVYTITNNIITRYELTGINDYNSKNTSYQSLIANNFISGTGNGMEFIYSKYVEIYNNSVLSNNLLCLNIDVSDDNLKFINNIFYNKAQNNCISVDGGANNLVFDYNDIYNDNGTTLANWKGTNCTNLAEWQSASSLGANSISVQPDYFSNTDLHTHSYNINNNGVSLPSVTTDIDGEARDASTPDIGADEFSPLAYNLAILDLQTASTSCDLSLEDVTIKIVNRGTGAQSNISVAYTVDSGATVISEHIPVTLNVNDTTVYTFTNKADFSTPGEYICTAYTNLYNDEYRNDDTLHSDLIVSYGNINNFPFLENFEIGKTFYFREKNNVQIENIAGNNSTYGVSFSGGDMSGGSSTDSATVWGADSTTFPTLYSCDVDVSSLTNPVLQFDMKITNNNNRNQSWLRVLVNDTIQIPDIESNYSQHSMFPTAYLTKTYELSAFASSNFKLSIQVNSTYEKIYIDNIKIGNAPIVDLGSDIVLCEGDSAVIDAGAGTNYSYAWFELGNNDTIGTNQTIKIGETGTYFVDVVNDDNIVISDTVNITVNPTYFYTEQYEICDNDSLLWHANYYNTAGTYYDSLLTINGCDSVYEMNLITNPTYFFTQTQEICDNDSLLWHGNYYNTAGTYYDSLQTTNGCDSIFEMTLIVNPTYFYTETQEICDNDSLLWRGNYYFVAGTYFDSLQTINGCDSVYELQLITNPTYYFIEQYQTCDNDSLLWHGNYYNTAGTYFDSLQTINGCDSIFEMSLIINPTYYITEQYVTCNNEPFMWHGNYYDTTGTYYDSLQTTSGCDSIFEMSLIVNPTYYFVDTMQTCDGNSVEWRENYYSVSGIYFDSLQTISGCDSIYALQLNITPVYYITEELNSCEDTAEWHGNYYTEAGIYYDSLQTINGCDSIFEVQINFNQKYYIIETDTICDSYNGTIWHGQYIPQSGIYYDYLTTQAGCDSTFEYRCTLGQSATSEEVGHICQGEQFYWHNNIYTEGNWYYDTLQTYLGCDSICKLVLYVHSLPTGTFHGPDTAMYGDTVNYIFSTWDNIDSWNIENGTIIEYLNEKNVNVVWDTIGLGKIYVIYDNGGEYPCYDTAYKNVYISTVGINDIANNKKIKVYPNPTKKYVYIDYNKYFKARVYNILGEMILETEESRIDISLLYKGNYIIKITDSKGRIIKIAKIIKQ